MRGTGIVVIGRNEGERLGRSLDSALAAGLPVIYVDSGSADGSPQAARARGCPVLQLDPARPFSAARARNEGVEEILRLDPNLEFIQLLDGDSVLEAGWLDRARRELDARPDVCAVLGRLREAHPERSLWNRICDLEWNQPPGDVPCFGGIVLLRAAAFRGAGGFDTGLIAGEEPELAQRLRRDGGRIVSLDVPMAVHDAAMTRFGQWWRRSVRSGYAYAHVCASGRGWRGRFGLRQSLRVWAWGPGLAAAAAGAAWIRPAAPLLLLAALVFQCARVAAFVSRRGAGPGLAAAYGALWPLSIAAQWLGQLRFLTRRESRLIEYKTPAEAREAGNP
ncbi:MAG TPA: glycosyltransferase family A protein [Planctomycetota bacterium]